MSPTPTRTSAKAARPITPAVRTRDIRYAVRDIVLLAEQAAAAGKEMLYLNIGDPNLFDFAPPEHVVEATYRAMRNNFNGYASSVGLPEALTAIQRYAAKKGITNIVHTCVTSGVSEAIDLALTALVNAGENVLVPAPGYPLYNAVLAKLSAGANEYYLDEDNDWQPDLADIARKIDKKTRGVVVINPNNPTGSSYAVETLRGLIDLALEHNLVIFADEIYEKHTSLAALNPEAPVVTFNGLSKAYVVPGFRIGWGVISGNRKVLEQYSEAIQKLARARLSANHPEQFAIAPALDGPQDHLTEMMAKLTRRRDVTVQMLSAIKGVSCVKPGGAFYAFPRLHIKGGDEEFVAELIRETGVVVVPGSGFGQRPGTKHCRIVFLPDEKTLEKAYNRFEQIIRKYAAG
jgi:alanine-synthesizing transaminase